jgi:hypothetical protein
MKTTRYFEAIRERPDRIAIEVEWIETVIRYPLKETIQQDGRIRRWGLIPEAGNQYLRVVLLLAGGAVHNAFFDRRFTP